MALQYSPSYIYRSIAVILHTGRHLAELRKLLTGRSHHARTLDHIEGDFTHAVVEALTSIATGESLVGFKGRALMPLLFNENHPMSDPENLARAVILGSDTFAEEVLEKGYAAAASDIGRHLLRLASTVDVGEKAYEARLRSLPTAPGLVFHGYGLDHEVLKSLGYDPKPRRVHLPARGLSVAVLTQLLNPTKITGVRKPEEVAASFLAAFIMQAVLENRYTLVAYAAADILSGGGAMTILGPARAPLTTPGGDVTVHAQEALSIVEQVFRAAGHRPPKKPFLENYLRKVGELASACEKLAGARLNRFDMRPYYELYEYTGPAREAAHAVVKGLDPDAEKLVKKPSHPFRLMEPLHHLVETLPYLTEELLKALVHAAARAVALALLDIPKTSDRMDYMRTKRRLSYDAAYLLTAVLTPVNAYIQEGAGGPGLPTLRGVERLAWGIMANSFPNNTA